MANIINGGPPKQNGIHHGDESFPLVTPKDQIAEPMEKDVGAEYDEDGETRTTEESYEVTIEYDAKGRPHFVNRKGMHWFITALFIVGETAGGGLIALPSAMVSAGLVGGTIIILIGALICTYTGQQLGDCWTILQKRWPEYRMHCRNPYPAIAGRALGPKFAHVVSVCLNVTQFGTAVVFLLLGARNIETFAAMMGIHVDFCILIMFVGMGMLPVTWLKSPKDFWGAIMAAMGMTAIAVLFIVFGAAYDSQVCKSVAHYPDVNWSKVSMCFGTVMFAYGGHGAFPTIQHDMKTPEKFNNSISIAFIIIICMYLPVSLAGYLTYGDSLQDSIIPSLQINFIRIAVNAMITFHVILALTIVFNPLNQELEHWFKISHKFGWQRIAVRSLVMVVVVMVAVTFPSFGVLLDLVGGSTITLMALFFPALFSLFLKAAYAKYDGAPAKEKEPALTFRQVLQHTSSRDLAVNAMILVIAIIGGFAATSAAMNAMYESNYATPCWWGLIKNIEKVAAPITNENATIACCGKYRNITSYPADHCIAAGAYVSSGSHG